VALNFKRYIPLFAMTSEYIDYKEAFYKVLCDERKNNQKLDAFIFHNGGLNLKAELDIPAEQIARYRTLLDTNTMLGNLLKQVQADLNDVGKLHASNLLLKQVVDEWDANGVSLSKPGRKVLKQGKLCKVGRKKEVVYQFVLFDDLLIYGSVISLGNKQYKLHNALLLENMSTGAVVSDGNPSDILLNMNVEAIGSAAIALLATSSVSSLSFNIFMQGDKSFRVKSLSSHELCTWWMLLSKAVAGTVHNNHLEYNPVWQPDKSSTKCTLCCIDFSSTRRRHHCRVCGMLVCDSCSPQRVSRIANVQERNSPLILLSNSKTRTSTTMVRACRQCFQSDKPRLEQQVVFTHAAHQLISVPNKGARSHAQQIYLEIVKTEESYLKGIQALQALFMKPLLDDYRSGAFEIGGDICNICGPDLASMLVFFSSLKYIITVSEQLLKGLQAESIAEVFLRYAPLFQLYDEYSMCFEFASRCIASFKTEKFRSFLEIQLRENHGELQKLGAHSICSLLILPIQRLPRYILLLKELHKVDTSDSQLETAIHSVQRMTSHINNMIRKREELVHMYDLSKIWGLAVLDGAPDRILRHQGELKKQSRKATHVYQFLLFNDVIMYGNVIDSKHIKHHRTMKLEKFHVEDADDELAFDIHAMEKSFRVYASTSESKAEWLRAIAESVSQIAKAKLIRSLDSSRDVKVDIVQCSPIWIQDGPHCLRCQIEFTLMKRRHHCRSCGLLVCAKCSSHKKLLNFSPTPKRVCNDCFMKESVN